VDERAADGLGADELGPDELGADDLHFRCDPNQEKYFEQASRSPRIRRSIATALIEGRHHRKQI